MTCVLYAFGEKGRNNLLKIGTCSKSGADRFKECVSTNSRGIDIVAIWPMRDKAEMQSAERRVHSMFDRLSGASGREWFDVGERSSAVERISHELNRRPLAEIPFDAAGILSKPYDMLREASDVYSPRGLGHPIKCQRRIWLHEEIGGEYRKISHNTWWVARRSTGSNAKQITYNTSAIRPASCWEWPLEDHEQTAARWHEINPLIVAIWEEAVRRFGIDGPPVIRCGWTTKALSELEAWLADAGLRRRTFTLGSPPPIGTKDYAVSSLK